MNLRLLTPVLAAVCAAQPVADPAGTWSGAVEVPGLSLGFEVVLKAGPAWSGTISVPAQKLKDVALSDVRVQGDAVTFRMAGIPGDPQFQGRIQGAEIQGTLLQGGQSFPFHLARGAAAPEVRPSLPAGLAERDVTVGAAPWALPGTLTLPAGKGPWPALVLVHGSGPHDRDEAIGPNAPFRDLAWSLAQRGVAVLRYEKRTKAHPAACAQAGATFTVWDETVLDAAAAAEVLRGTKEVDPRRVFILGHSLGGYLLPRIASKAPFAAGFISLAGCSRPMEDLLLEQMTYLSVSEDQLAQTRLAVARVKALEPGKAPGGPLPLGIPAAYWLDLKGYDPAREAQALHQPMLILQGDRDYQVGAADLARWSKALAGRKNVRIQRFPGLNHLFMAGTGPASPEEYLKAGHVDGAVVDMIAAWIQGR